MKRFKLYKKVTEVFGIALQTIKTIEECGELIQILSKTLLDKGNKEHLAEELADVQIMVEQMIFLYNLEKDVKKYKLAKLKRMQKRLENG